MAALVAGVQYGLSSHSNFHENKSLIFVKLTDSAQRAIEDFLRNRYLKNKKRREKKGKRDRKIVVQRHHIHVLDLEWDKSWAEHCVQNVNFQRIELLETDDERGKYLWPTIMANYPDFSDFTESATRVFDLYAEYFGT
ncbi:hypothetical protein WN51_11098 [Melipona quadrifasciata]|uniref:RNA polymerase II elongation factor ELL N-terminal domain-containing protein n=1 Tax=Melipona quadrifasciata TaxID=166423 RepID=A0A0N0BI05_9HYME|nr:hypothetical protein WN51_11098 [Melipona quadrifasciata]